MPLLIDQMQRSLQIPEPPERIVSLVPSQTELLMDLGVGEKVVGITKFCVHPKSRLKHKTIIGGTKNFHFEKIAALRPDLIIGNKEENYREGIEKLEGNFPVWMSDIFTLDDALQMIKMLGEVLGRSEKANLLADQIKSGFENLTPLPAEISCIYLIWKKPYMGVGGNTFIYDMLGRCGLNNLLSKEERYPVLKPEDFPELNPQLILLSSEPYPFKEQHIAEIKDLCPETEVMLVDGEMFSWYGSRLLKSAPYLQNFMKEVKLRLKI